MDLALPSAPPRCVVKPARLDGTYLSGSTMYDATF